MKNFKKMLKIISIISAIIGAFGIITGLLGEVKAEAFYYSVCIFMFTGGIFLLASLQNSDQLSGNLNS
jgi:preprotein translocase subunit SecY